VNKLANVIWAENWDEKYFFGQCNQDVICKGIHGMYEVNLKPWKTI
jgi:hypothetical protein